MKSDGEGLSAERVQSIVATALADPCALLAWQRNPAGLVGVETESFDWERMRQFAGVATKIRHNPLRVDMRLTFRAISLAGLDVELFAAYAPVYQQQRPGFRDTAALRIAWLQFLETWLDARQPVHLLVLELAHHEARLAELRMTSAPVARNVAAPPLLVSDAVVLVPGACLAECRIHPNDAVSAVEAGTLECATHSNRSIAYWPGEAGAQLAEADELSVWIFGELGVPRTAMELSEHLERVLGQAPGSSVFQRINVWWTAGLLLRTEGEQR